MRANHPITPLAWGAVLLLLGAGAAPAWEVSGSSRTAVRGSWADAAPGQDDRGAYASEHLTLAATALPLGGTAFLSAAYRWDLGHEDPDSTFYSSVDRFPGGRHLFVYEAGVSARPVAWAEVTAGRFSWESAEPVHLDGAAVRLDLPPVPGLAGWSAAAFGGRIVQLYDDLEEEAVRGLGLEARLPWGTRASVDYLGYFDDLTRVTVRQAVGDAASARASAEWVNSSLREATASATLWLEASGTEVTATAVKKIGNEEDDDFLFDFTADADPGRYRLERLALDRQAPYHQYALAVTQAVTGAVSVSLAYTKRDLLDEDHYESAGNTSFDVVQAGVALRELVVRGLDLDGQVSWWREDRLAGREARSRSYSLTAEQRVTAAWSLSAAYYWKAEDLNHELENATARSLRLGARYRPAPAWTVGLEYTRDTDDLLDQLYGVDRVESVETRVTYRF
ncbi:MAG: hypothetical protein ACYDA8_01980 [Deferrisomatales bacterium]